MRHLPVLNRLTALLALLPLLSGCSPRDAVTKAGTSILQSVGLADEPQQFTPAQPFGAATSDPSPENEYYLGRAVAAKLLGRYHAVHNPKVDQYLAEILAVVAAASERPVLFRGYRVVVIDSNEVFAMSAPGGFILISTGMLATLKNEDEIAAVLAHEVAHIEQRHGIKSLSSEKRGNALQALGTVAGSLYCADVVRQAVLVLNVAVDDIVTTLVERGYSRDQEFEADKRAVAILIRAGYNPAALSDVLSALSHTHKGTSGGWFATHPPASERLSVVDVLVVSYSEPKSRPRIARYIAVFGVQKAS